MVYRTLFVATGIHLSKTGLQITHDMYINLYFVIFFDLTTDRGASEVQTSHPVNGNIRIYLKFNKLFTEAFTCLLYLEFHNWVLIYFSRNVTTNF